MWTGATRVSHVSAPSASAGDDPSGTTTTSSSPNTASPSLALYRAITVTLPAACRCSRPKKVRSFRGVSVASPHTRTRLRNLRMDTALWRDARELHRPERPRYAAVRHTTVDAPKYHSSASSHAESASASSISPYSMRSRPACTCSSGPNATADRDAALSTSPRRSTTPLPLPSIVTRTGTENTACGTAAGSNDTRPRKFHGYTSTVGPENSACRRMKRLATSPVTSSGW
mmetsp:Transcript_51935/g.130416  ORF Transcript_51935/g.130416 Transcript_51935/m.130416 type:complete len:230 (-) Transcript_51935:1299-1988(-)